MKYLIVFVLFVINISIAQEMTYGEWKEHIGIISEVLIKEQMLERDSAGVWYSPVKTEEELMATYNMYVETYRELKSYETEDVILGSSYSLMSGLGLGLLESHSFGYRYPDLSDGNWFKDWATMNTAGDQLFKLHHPNKVGREINDVFDRLAYQELETFYGKWYWAYIHHFVVKNTMATIYRGWAKYGKPFYYFSIEFDIDWFIHRVFGVGE